MSEFDQIEERFELIRQIIKRLNNENFDKTNNEELKKIFLGWKVIEMINEFEKKLDILNNKYEVIKKKLKRNSIKLYFFGRLSSGKTTIINGIIRKHLFKSTSQHTTSCFVHIKKSENTNYKIIHEGNEKLFNNINEAKVEINKLSTFNKRNNFKTDKFIEVFVPVDEENKILKENIELIDSPGSGKSENITNDITEYAKDANIIVFVLMHDITENDEKFFEFQLKNSTKPDIFVLINKWNDTDNEEDEENKQTKKSLKGKCDELIMKMNEDIVKDMRERTYFISANEIFDIRINNNNEYVSNEKKKQRYKSFEKFESKLSEYIQNIDKQYSQELVDIKTELCNEFKYFRENILNNSSDFIKIINKYKKQLSKYVDKIKEECNNTEKKCIDNIKCAVTKMMNTINIDDSKEIKEFIRLHYWGIDADIGKLYKSLDEKRSIIQEKYVTENNGDGTENEIKKTFAYLGENELKIETDMQFETFPKSKTAVKILSFVPIVGFIATNILLFKIDRTDERHSNKSSLKELENEIHATDKEKIEAVNENIKKIKKYFTDEINIIIERNNIKLKCLDFLKETINLHNHLLE